MTQATDEDRALMGKWFGDEIDDAGPTRFLDARGWTFPGGMCTPPVSSYHPSQYELACVGFLCDEWDYAYEGMPDLIEYPAKIGADGRNNG